MIDRFQTSMEILASPHGKLELAMDSDSGLEVALRKFLGIEDVDQFIDVIRRRLKGLQDAGIATQFCLVKCWHWTLILLVWCT